MNSIAFKLLNDYKLTILDLWVLLENSEYTEDNEEQHKEAKTNQDAKQQTNQLFLHLWGIW